MHDSVVSHAWFRGKSCIILTNSGTHTCLWAAMWVWMPCMEHAASRPLALWWRSSRQRVTRWCWLPPWVWAHLPFNCCLRFHCMVDVNLRFCRQTVEDMLCGTYWSRCALCECSSMQICGVTRARIGWSTRRLTRHLAPLTSLFFTRSEPQRSTRLYIAERLKKRPSGHSYVQIFILEGIAGPETWIYRKLR